MAKSTTTRKSTTTATTTAPATKKAPATRKAAARGEAKSARSSLVESRKSTTKKAPAPATKKAPAKSTKSTPAPATKKAPAKSTKSSTLPANHPGTTWKPLMEKSGKSRTEVAEGMGVAYDTLSRVLLGKSLPTATQTVKFAATVGADPRKLWQDVADVELAEAMGK